MWGLDCAFCCRSRVRRGMRLLRGFLRKLRGARRGQRSMCCWSMAPGRPPITWCVKPVMLFAWTAVHGQQVELAWCQNVKDPHELLLMLELALSDADWWTGDTKALLWRLVSRGDVFGCVRVLQVVRPLALVDADRVQLAQLTARHSCDPGRLWKELHSADLVSSETLPQSAVTSVLPLCSTVQCCRLLLLSLQTRGGFVVPAAYHPSSERERYVFMQARSWHRCVTRARSLSGRGGAGRTLDASPPWLVPHSVSASCRACTVVVTVGSAATRNGVCALTRASVAQQMRAAAGSLCVGRSAVAVVAAGASGYTLGAGCRAVIVLLRVSCIERPHSRGSAR